MAKGLIDDAKKYIGNYYYNGEWYDRKNGEEINIEDLDDEKKNQLNYYKNKMDEELTISNSIVLNNLLK